MELYGKKSSSIPQKLIIVFIEFFLLCAAYQILFGSWGHKIYDLLGLNFTGGNYTRNLINFSFSIIVFLRLTFMMFFLLKRAIPWEEAISIPMAFALYYIGFALFTCNQNVPLNFLDVFGILVFLSGSFINTYSELQRHFWKQQPQHKGRLYREGLFKYSMHINYFGDLLWVVGYAVLAYNEWAWLIPAFLFCFFAFYNIPQLDGYLHKKYKQQFEQYARNTKKFIPFIY